MAKKGVLSQGTHVWILHGDTPTLTKMDCVKAFVMGDDSTTEIKHNLSGRTKNSNIGLWGLDHTG